MIHWSDIFRATTAVRRLKNPLKHLFVMKPSVFFLIFILCVRSHAQNVNQLLHLAREYEQAGRWTESRHLLESLYSDHPDHPIVYERLKDLYMNTFAYTHAKALIEKKLEQHPDHPHIEVDLGRVIYRMGNEQEAFHRLDAVLKKYTLKDNVYQMVASAYTSERLYDRAIETYLKGRKLLNRPDLYTINLSQLYAAQSEYKKASEELIVYLKKNPDRIHFVQNVYLKYPKSERVLSQLADPIIKAITDAPNLTDLYRLLAKLYEHHESYGDALKVIQTLEKKSPEKNQGTALFQFAEDVFLKGSVNESKAAFQKILTSYPQFQRRDQVLFGLAKCYEAESDFHRSIDTYNQIIDEFPKRAFTQYAALRLGLLQRDRLFDQKSAIQTFSFIKKNYPFSSAAWTAEIELALCYIIDSDTSSAIPLLLQNINRKHPDRPGHALQAMYYLGQLYYYNGNYEKSLACLDSLASNKWHDLSFQHPVVNDGLQLRFFIKRYAKTYPLQLHYISRADYLSFKRKYNEACTILDTVIRNDIHIPIQGDALFKKATLFILLKKPDKALSCFQLLLDNYPNHFLSDHALERCGYLYEKLNNDKLALLQYEKLLTDYPHSLFIEDIRNRIRNIEKELQ